MVTPRPVSFSGSANCVTSEARDQHLLRLVASMGARSSGSSDKPGAFPASSPQTPENMAATIYSALGIRKTAAWRDPVGRLHYVYH